MIIIQKWNSLNHDSRTPGFLLRLARIAFVYIVSIVLWMSISYSNFAYSQDYASIIDRCEPYRDTVESILVAEGVDLDYYYLMVAESRCTPKARSKVGARGFWQLMPSTSQHYGCFHPDDIDCATKAAAKYIKHLQKSFKTFNEVIAAYNMGGHNLRLYGATNQAKGLVFLVNRLIREAAKSELNEDDEIWQPEG